MSAEALATWLLGIMVASVAPGRARFPKEAVESEADGRVRYAALARGLADVTLDSAEQPLFDGPNGRARTAALLLALSYHESAWRRDVDLGLGGQAHPRYFCVMQVAVRDRTPEGWTGADLVAERERCFRAALHILERSRGSCRDSGPDAWLRIYTSGHCHQGVRAADERFDTYRRWLSKFPLPDPPH
jgi:hypothetical protein